MAIVSGGTPPGQAACVMEAAAKVAAIYARVSTEEQGKGYSIPTQIAGVQQLLEGAGYMIPEHYIFRDNVSGTTLERPDLRRLRALVQARALQAIGIYDPDRLSRNLGHQLLLAHEAEEAGVQLLFVSYPLERGPEGWLFFQMRGALAEYERAKILQRMQRGLKARAQAGNPGGGQVPFGYRAIREPHKARWELHPEEAAIVQRIFALCLDGWSCRRIAWQFTSERIPTRYDRHPGNGGAKGRPVGTWAPGTIQHMLTNETYIGTAYWRVEASGERIAIAVPPLLDAATFAAVQAQLARNKQRARRNRRRDYLLAGRLRCALCGRSMTGYTVRAVRRYRCTSAAILPSAQRCHVNIKADDIEEWIWQEVEKRLRRPALIAQEVARQEATAAAQEGGVQHDLTLIDAALGQCAQEDTRWLRAYAAEAISDQELKNYRASIAHTRQGLEADRARLTARMQEVHLSRARVQALETYCQRVGATLTRFDHAEKQQAVEQLEVQATWAPTTRLRIRMTIPWEEDAPLVTPAVERVRHYYTVELGTADEKM